MKTININLIAFPSAKAIGTYVYIKRLLKQLSKMNLEGDYHFYIYIRKGFPINDLILPHCSTIIYVPSFKNSFLRILFEQTVFYLYLRRSDYFFTPCLSMPLFINSCKVLTIHDLVPFIVREKYNWSRGLFIRTMTFIAAKLADKIVTVSQNSKRDIINILKIPNSKIDIVYNFIDSNEDIVTLGKIMPIDLQKMGLTSPYFLNVSTLQPGKNVERLIRAFKSFCSFNNNYQLCIVGNKGWGYKAIFDEVKKYKMENNIIFTGYVSDHILSCLYEQCYGVVYVSLYEGFGIPPLEGFYHSKACVCSQNSSLPEVVGDAGVLVDPIDENSICNGMIKFIQIRELLENNAKNRLIRFDPIDITNNFISIFS